MANIEKAKDNKPDEKKPQTVQDFIRSMEPQFRMILPHYMDAGRLVRIALTELRRVPKLRECTTESLLGALMMCAYTGLEPGPGGEAYLLPYKNNKTQKMEVQFQEGYKGKVKLCRNSSELSTINANVVYENDKFSYSYGLNEHLDHVPTDGERGKIIKAYAYAKLKDGSHQFTVMTMADINKRRNASKAKDCGPWVDWPEEMIKKTMIRSLTKLLPLSYEDRRKLELDETTKYFIPGQTVDISTEPDITDWEGTGEKPEISAPRQKAAETTKVDEQTGEVLTLTREPIEAEAEQ